MNVPGVLGSRPRLRLQAPDSGRSAGTPVSVLARHGQSSVPRLAAALAVLAGLLNLLSALLPAERYRLRLLAELVPGAVSRGATVAVAAAGIGLLLLAGGLRRRHRAASLTTVGLLAAAPSCTWSRAWTWRRRSSRHSWPGCSAPRSAAFRPEPPAAIWLLLGPLEAMAGSRRLLLGTIGHTLPTIAVDLCWLAGPRAGGSLAGLDVGTSAVAVTVAAALVIVTRSAPLGAALATGLTVDLATTPNLASAEHLLATAIGVAGALVLRPTPRLQPIGIWPVAAGGGIRRLETAFRPGQVLYSVKANTARHEPSPGETETKGGSPC